ncbi:hypothetical protein L3X38_030170 [Prunus dulcis]|uniref:Uncharacterized protein n=1 Tax=Prunus dulcis TaxID=3755 RepID=A0AAD4YTV2_PRUDU|nr:hypothetical protein L3X38_030170 [Prunus dulcis]
MALKPKAHLGLIPILIFFISINPRPSLSLSESPATVFEILPKYGLPSGTSTLFEYLVYYEKTITGKLTYGAITELKGIQVQRFLFWFDVDEIRVDLPPSDSIYFTVGIINKKLDVDQFQNVHSCRNGLSGSCLGSLKRGIQLPSPVEDIEMLITE